MKFATHSRRFASQRPALFLLIFGCLACMVPTVVDAYVFTRDLKLGDTGEDVRALQVGLNADVRTRVAESGPGSPGSETGFFGEKTQSAVILYQNLHTKDILTPLGLSRGTGYVGPATRQRLSGVVTTDTDALSSKKTIDQVIAAFDTVLNGSVIETNRSPVDDPRIPDTQEELVAAVGDFAGTEATGEEIEDFSRQMVLVRYGYAPNVQQDSDDDDNGDDDDGGAGSTGCIGLLLDLLGL